MPAEPRIKIFSGTYSEYLAKGIALALNQDLGQCTIQHFNDGEFQPVITESVRGDYVFFVQSTNAPTDNLFELLLMIDAARRASAGYITAVIPYFGFARQDRKDKPRVSIGSKLIANLLTAAGANRIMTMDLHAPQIQGFFDIPVDHLESNSIFIDYLKELNLDNSIVFASPDVGSTNRARQYAQYFKCDLVICDKHRKRANEIASMTVIGDVSGRDVIICDDIIDTASTLCNAAALMIEKGAKSVRAITTHPVLSGTAVKKIEDSKLTEVVVCNTIPTNGKQSPKIKVLDVSALFGKAISNMFEHKSISSLFVN